MKKIALLALMALAYCTQASAQCETWNNAANKDELTTQHTLYRDYIKTENFEAAFPIWKELYAVAPAADGQRATHYQDGRAIYLSKWQNATDEAQKAEYMAKINELYAAQEACYPKQLNYMYGDQVYNMFYQFNSDYDATLAVIERAIEKGGNNTDYRVITPYGIIAVYQYNDKTMDADRVRGIHAKIKEIVDYNVQNKTQLAAYYKQSADAVEPQFESIAPYIYDCEYFLPKLTKQYQANPDDRDNYLEVYKKLAQYGCEQSLPIMTEIAAKDQAYLDEERERKREEWRETNPYEYARVLFYKDKNYDEAATYLQRALESGIDSESEAKAYMLLASIQSEKGDKSGARNYARKAAQAKPGWGEPHLFIGDLYRSTRCGGDGFEQRKVYWAAYDEYAKATNDPDTAAEARRKMSSARGGFPDKETGFMKGVKEGSGVSIGCWIGVSTTARY